MKTLIILITLTLSILYFYFSAKSPLSVASLLSYDQSLSSSSKSTSFLSTPRLLQLKTYRAKLKEESYIELI